MRIRLAEPADLTRLGEITVAAYAGFTLGPDDPYVAKLADAATRAAQAELWVAVDGERPLGSVTSCPPGSPWREIAREDEGEFRMLSVDPHAQGRGVARALVGHVEARWSAAGAAGMAISSLPEMTTAHGLYASLGYVRDPERDWSPVKGVRLITFAKEL